MLLMSKTIKVTCKDEIIGKGKGWHESKQSIIMYMYSDEILLRNFETLS
jgi:hypothetical protein